MFKEIFKKFFGSRNERLVKQYLKIVEQINALEEEISALNDDQLKAKTDEFRQRIKDGAKLDQLLPEAFAVVREAGKRVFNMRHFDVQLVGGMVLNDGKIAEMRTGEGKTLVATLAGYLNALTGRGVHVITVNDYLASRDAEWMGRLYNFLGMSVGAVVANMSPEDKRAAYAADITYGTNNEYGFDYLRDNMAFSIAEKFQRDRAFGIVDEVDSILIDEARTPLIISGPAEESSEHYYRVNELAPQLTKQEEEEGPGDYSVEEKSKQIFLTEEGHQHVEELLARAGLLQEGGSLYDMANIGLMHHVNAALRAHVLFQNDVDYIVKNNQIIIVDEFTGRTMEGRRWSDGLHQAIEAKEGVPIQQENQTLASITFQNYFRLYDKLSGMTGTADTEAFEFQQIYGLEVMVIPTHRPMIRDDRGDQIYLTQRNKFTAIVQDIKDCKQRKQPVLVGTASIEVSEFLSKVLDKEKIKHEVLNAKHHEREADIIAEAGRPGAVTIATNMAGRGTDIVLGGNFEVQIAKLKNPPKDKVKKLREEWEKAHAQVIESGGLHITGTERHESRRIDNQLRGRAGRQGDPGSSRFYLSLEDNLMRIFASDRISNIMKKLGMEEGEAIEHSMVTRAIENAQRKVEGHNFDMRKNLLEYDDVANDQRKEIYKMRDELMSTEDISETIDVIREDVLTAVIDTFIPPESLEEQWDVPGLEEALEGEFALKLDIRGWLKQDDTLHEEPLRQRIHEEMLNVYKDKENEYGADTIRYVEKQVALDILDTQWKDHLATMDQLRQGIHLRGYAQKNPKQEYKRESFELFGEMLERFKNEVISILCKIQIRSQEEVEAMEAQRHRMDEENMQFKHDEAGGMGSAEPNEDDNTQPYVREGRKIGRNEPCPCGSGKKYKQCHGKLS